MRIGINPWFDMVFKQLFGSEENKPLLLSLVNAVLEQAGEQPSNCPSSWCRRSKSATSWNGGRTFSSMAKTSTTRNCPRHWRLRK